MIPKSLPLCFEGDFNNLSTFSNNTKGVFFSSSISAICQNNLPFLPSIPFSLLLERATE